MEQQDELEARVKAAQQMVKLLDERYRALEARTATALPATGDLVHRAELEQALEKQQRRFADELLFFTAVLATPGGRMAAQEKRGPAVTAQDATTAPAEVSGAGKKVVGPAPEEPPVARQAQALKKPAVALAKGEWVVYLRSFGSRGKAEKALAGYHEKVPAMVLLEARVKGRSVYRLAVTGLASKKEALAYRAEARRKLGFRDAWIGRG
jgi:hypothetical protein